MNYNEEIEITDALLMAYINGELDQQIEERVQQWRAVSEENKIHFEKLRKAWEISGEIRPKPVVVDPDNAWDKVLDRINQTDSKVIPMQPKRSFKRVYWSVAAVAILLIGVVGILRMTGGGVNEITRFAETAGVVDQLDDGSVVTLNANTSLVYPEEFEGDERRVSLNGEAFFEIERNEEKPFIIDLQANSYVKVLGTSFNIKSFESDSLIEVFVKTGKVEFGTDTTNNVILIAGQKGIMNKFTGEIETPNDPSIGLKETYWIDQEIIFDGEGMDEVLNTLNTIFDQEIILNCEAAKDCTLVSTHKEESLDDILSVIIGVHDLSLRKERNGEQMQYILDCHAY